MVLRGVILADDLSCGTPESHSFQSDLNRKNLNLWSEMENQKWTKEEVECIRNYYKQKNTDWQQLLKKLKRTKRAVITRASIMRLSNKQTNWKAEELEKLKKEYKNKKVFELAQEFDRTAGAIRRILSKKGVKKRICWHKYRIDHNFFSEWTKKSAYVLGLISADGCVNDRDKHYSVELSSKDKSLLENVKKLLNFTKNIEKSRNTFRLRIDNKAIYEDIIKKGILPRKSKSLKFPNVPEECLDQFIRGFFDGDGSVYQLGDGRIVVKFSCWSPPFLEKLQKIISKRCKVREKKIHDNSIVYYPKEVFRVLKFLYKKSTTETRLDRKYERYLRFCGGNIQCAA